jgi:enamine deaminase RidA (YjgF/YER057c/UK114 family)
MEVKRLVPGPRMSQCVIAGGLVFLAGQVADDTAAGVEAQTDNVLAKIDALLAQAGSDKTRIVSATIYLPDIGTFADMNKAWDRWVAPGATPARATVEARLASAGYRVEIQVVAALL